MFKARGSFEGAIRRKKGVPVEFQGMSGGFQLGAGGGNLHFPGVPDTSGDESPAKKQRGKDRATRSGVNKAKKEAGADASLQAQTVTLGLGQLEALLDKQSEKILAANRAHAQGLLDALEERQGERFMTIERSVGIVQHHVGNLEDRLAAVEAKMQHGLPKDQPERRRWTLVFGGWERDTKKSTVLAELQQACSKLMIEKEFDEPPFTTGPRRSVALANFGERAGESEADRRARMHRVVLAFAGEKMLTAKKKLWAGYSKTKMERDIASHCSWVRRAMMGISAEFLEDIDCEYGTGSVWMGSSLVASVTRDIPGGIDSHDVVLHGKGAHKGWVHVKGLSHESKIPETTIRDRLDAEKR